MLKIFVGVVIGYTFFRAKFFPGPSTTQKRLDFDKILHCEQIYENKRSAFFLN